jgi:hypothetical protein
VRLRLPSETSADLREILADYFDSNGFLLKDNLRRFEQVLEKLRTVDETAVVYSAVLDFIDRENELTRVLRTSAATCS